MALPTASVVASSNSPVRIDRRANPRLTFIVPMANDEAPCTTIGRQTLHWGRGLGGVFMPQGDQRVLGTSGWRSQIAWQLDAARLQDTAERMLGPSRGTPDLQLDRLRLLPTQVAGLSTEATWQSFVPMLGLLRQHPGHPVALGLEDVLYRHTVMLLRPDLFEQPDEPPRAPSGHPRLQQVCEHIEAHLGEPITLTDLERVSGQSIRSLQLAFQARFGLTPTAWIRQRRLDRVRQGLLLQPWRPVQSIAYEADFQSLPAFFKAYREAFGETPGGTRRPG